MSPQAAGGQADGDVLSALRLGWMVAELRGRYREQLRPDPNSAATKFDRSGNALPLQEERGPKELAIEVEHAVIKLAADLSLPLDAAALRNCTSAAQDAVDDPGWAAAWNALAGCLYEVDAKFQDALYADALLGEAAYQLGRALGEVTWALDPVSTSGSTSLTFLLGEERVKTVRRLLRRLRQGIDEVTATAVGATLDAWAPVAVVWPAVGAAAADTTNADRSAKAADFRKSALTALRNQAGVWHDLLLDRAPWLTLVDPKDAIKHRPSLAPLRPFWPELIVGTLGLAGLALALGLLAIHGQGAWGALLAVLSAAGVTTASVRARLKDQAQNLVGQMQRAYNIELAAEAVLRPPPALPNLAATPEAPAAR